VAVLRSRNGMLLEFLPTMPSTGVPQSMLLPCQHLHLHCCSVLYRIAARCFQLSSAAAPWLQPVARCVLLCNAS
jgi:hypothetical protein